MTTSASYSMTTGYVGIDIDTGYDEDGFLTPIAADILGKCKELYGKEPQRERIPHYHAGFSPLQGEEQPERRGDLQGIALLHYDRRGHAV